MNSKDKGKRGERELATLLTENGFPAERGVQYSGSPDSPDVKCPSLDFIHWECKRTERLNVYKAMEQAHQDRGWNQVPVIAHRKNNKEWLAILPLEDFLTLLKNV